MLNVTIAGNSTNFEGGGIENKGVLRMFYVTITDNSAPDIRCSQFASRVGLSLRAVARRRDLPRGR